MLLVARDQMQRFVVGIQLQTIPINEPLIKLVKYIRKAQPLQVGLFHFLSHTQKSRESTLLDRYQITIINLNAGMISRVPLCQFRA